MKDLTFVNIEAIDPNIITDIRYATDNNFVGKAVYSHPVCFLRKEVAEKLSRVQKSLEKQKLGLKIYDGYRPRSVQYLFWEFLPDNRFVADPRIGSKHNRGAAVDVTLVDEFGKELLMPTLFDSFSEKAFSNCMDLPELAIRNRTILHEAMKSGGFLILPTEWWHFDDSDWELYPLEDIQLASLLGEST
jgi:D-alanyl-D-alanine dipeptidase